MEPAAAALVLLSALIHPCRDLTLKGLPNPASAYLGVSLLWILLAGAHAAATWQDLALPRAVWPLAAVSAFGLTFYYYGTLAALRIGDLSVYYPIIRSSPLAIVAFSFVLFGQSYSLATLGGIALIILAGLAIQRVPGSLFGDPRALGLAVLAMVASAVYSMADASAMRQTTPAAFLFWCYILVSLLLALACLGDGGRAMPRRRSLTDCWTAAPHRVLLAAVSSYASYYLILLAFQLGAEAAAVGAVRQASIPVSVLLATLMLKEPRFLGRLGWASLLAAGIVIIMLG